VNAPRVLDERLQLRARPGVFLAGQITGVEGYVESAACGLCVGALLGESLQGRPAAPPPDTTALGALLAHLRRPSDDFQPSNVVWSMFAPIEGVPRRSGRKERRERLAGRALAALLEWSPGRSGPAAPAPSAESVVQTEQVGVP
jgi:methylenetetrahydrofolate--tRNA-(uracil-5-)-methyltransferase